MFVPKFAFLILFNFECGNNEKEKKFTLTISILQKQIKITIEIFINKQIYQQKIYRVEFFFFF